MILLVRKCDICLDLDYTQLRMKLSIDFTFLEPVV
jgi:hypothetical protein